MGCGSSAKGKYAEGDKAAPEAAPAPAAEAIKPLAAAAVDGSLPAKVEAQAAGSAPPADTGAAAAPATTGETGAAAPKAEGTAAAAPAAAAPAADAAPAAEAAPAAAAAPAAEAAPAPKKAGIQFAEPEPDSEEEELEMSEEEAAAYEAQMEARATAAASAGPRKSRMAVSSEVVERDEDWEAPVFEKTAEQEVRLTQALTKCFMFAALSGEDLPVLIKAFREVPVTAGTTVINQGDEVVSDQPALYVFESGKLSVFKTGVEASVFKYDTAGQYFGDLALLYNAPRAATVKADEDCVLWSIDRNTFNYLVKDAARLAVDKRVAFLAEVEILKALGAEQRATLSDVMNVKFLMKDDLVIKQGDMGKEFFILESGSLEARKDGVAVASYTAGMYFGELALLKDAPRACDVVATETCKVLSLDQASFKRIVGDLKGDLEARAAENYK